MQRLFTGIAIPQDITNRLQLMQEGLKGARWIAPEDFHITLRFAGEVSEPVAEEIRSGLAQIDLPPFDLTLKGAGYFGKRQPRSMHVVVSPSAGLDMLHFLNERLMQAVGLEPDGRNFAPHVTLARFKNMKTAEAEMWTHRHSMMQPLTFTVENFCLFSSRPHGGGGPYRIEETYPLAATEPVNRNIFTS